MTVSIDEKTEVKGRGRLFLQPLDRSVDKEVLEIEIDLHLLNDELTLGDLKVAAREHAVEGMHEHAFRLWSAVAQVAERHRFPALITAAKANAAGSLERARKGERRAGSAPKAKRYDYDAISRDVDSGMTRAEVAAGHGCAASTVARAIEYVGVRDELLDDSPEIFDQLMAGVDVVEVARRYDVSPKIVRWLVRTQFDRRSDED